MCYIAPSYRKQANYYYDLCRIILPHDQKIISDFATRLILTNASLTVGQVGDDARDGLYWLFDDGSAVISNEVAEFVFERWPV